MTDNNMEPILEVDDLPGISLEKTVARIQQMMDATSEVTHNAPPGVTVIVTSHQVFDKFPDAPDLSELM